MRMKKNFRIIVTLLLILLLAAAAALYILPVGFGGARVQS